MNMIDKTIILAYEARTTTRPPWQVSLKGVEVCAQHSMTDH